MAYAKIARNTPEYQRLSGAMFAVGLATFAIFYCVQPLLPLFTRTFGVAAEEASLVVSLTIGPMALALPVAGVLSDRLGRRSLIAISLLAATSLTTLSAAAPTWHALLMLRFLAGLALSGIPAVAMTYILEEVDDAALSHAMGRYIAGTAMGGMTGRLLGGFLATAGGWRLILAIVGGGGIAAAILFLWQTPRASHFVPQRRTMAHFTGGLRRLASNPVIPWLFVEAFLLMGAFITVYNYVSYRLVAPPYGLSQTVVGAIFLLYLVGSLSSTLVGTASARLGVARTLMLALILFLAGVTLTALTPLPLLILGIAVITGAFFGAHSVASSWVGRSAGGDRAQAAALYLLFYYAGGSVLGSLGGVAWSHAGWLGVIAFTGGLVGIATLVGLRIAWNSSAGMTTHPK